MTQLPLVSLVIRCRRPGGLRAALQCAAAQTHAPLEVIVADLAAHAQDAWAGIAWPPGCVIRRVAGAPQLGEVRASNAALALVHGDYFCFLDDAGVFEPQHVAALLDQAQRCPAVLVVYAQARVFDAQYRQARIIGRPLHRALFFHEQTFCLQAALIRRRVLELGCRFDEALACGADHDFLEQVATRGEFVYLPGLPPSYACSQPDGDEAGAAATAPRIYFDNLRFAKWTGERLQHALRAALLSRRAARIAAAGEHERARAGFAAALAQYPGDPDALHGLAQCDVAAARWPSAWQCIARAIEFDPGNAAYRATAEVIRRALRQHGLPVPVLAPAPATAGGWSPRWAGNTLAAGAVTQSAPAPAPRNASCPCGSGRRYKHCCGRSVGAPTADAGVSDADAALVRRARDLLHAGEAQQAGALLALLRPPLVVDADCAREAGEMCLRMHLLQPALALLERAVTLSKGAPAAVAACDECCHLLFRATAWASAGSALRALLARIDASARRPARAPADVPLHIVCKLDTLGGTETRALNLYRQLAAHASVTLWSSVPPHAQHAGATPVRQIAPGCVPSGGTLVLVGTYFDCEPWLEQQPFERVVVCHNLAEQYPSLMERLIQIEANAAGPGVALTFPSQRFRDLAGLPGRVEYSAVDTDAFRRRAPRPARAALTIGRHGRAYAAKFHPNDPAFLRALIARGHAVRILGGTPIAQAFAGERAAPELLEVGQEAPREFLESLDIYVYRKHPGFYETGGTAILEAMAMELPVLVFDEQQCGIAEVIANGETGFLVDGEAQALDCIERLAADPALRRRVGLAARAAIGALMDRQNAGILAAYLGEPRAPLREAPWWQRLHKRWRGAAVAAD